MATPTSHALFDALKEVGLFEPNSDDIVEFSLIARVGEPLRIDIRRRRHQLDAGQEVVAEEIVRTIKRFDVQDEVVDEPIEADTPPLGVSQVWER